MKIIAGVMLPDDAVSLRVPETYTLPKINEYHDRRKLDQMLFSQIPPNFDIIVVANYTALIAGTTLALTTNKSLVLVKDKHNEDLTDLLQDGIDKELDIVIGTVPYGLVRGTHVANIHQRTFTYIPNPMRVETSYQEFKDKRVVIIDPHLNGSYMPELVRSLENVHANIVWVSSIPYKPKEVEFEKKRVLLLH
jgi:hypothetical protein